MNTSYKISENVAFEFIDSNAYILNIITGEYYQLSGSASMIWKEIEKGVNVVTIKNNIKSFFDNTDMIDDDIDEAIRDLVNLDLIIEN